MHEKTPKTEMDDMHPVSIGGSARKMHESEYQS
jgi:hypothetical protein